MANEAKLVRQVFKDYESKGHILECEITNVNIFKKSNKLTIDLKSNTKIQIGEKLEFEYYLKSRFRVQEVEINIDVKEDELVQKKTKAEKNEEKLDEVTPMIIGNKKAKISGKAIKIKDVSMDSGRVVICGNIIKQELKELKTRKLSFDDKCI